MNSLNLIPLNITRTLPALFKKLFILLFSISTCFAATKHDMVVTEQALASQVGARILKNGGNAIDAAVAVGYALAVVYPCCGNIGGGGFMTIHTAKGKNIFINFREKAPLAAKKDMYLDKDGNVTENLSTTGYLAVGVPGTVLGFETALKKYGTMTRQQVMAPAIQLAQQGFILTQGDVKALSDDIQAFKKEPNVASIFLKKNQQPYRAGDRLIQKELAHTLTLISVKGPAIFYRGEIANAIVKASNENDGILSKKDFANYTVELLSPLYCTFHNYTIISSPPPSSGGVTLCEILNIIERYPLKTYGFHTAKSTHYLVEAMRYAFYDRNNHLGDPDFVKNPVEQLISKDYADQIREKILDNQATPSSDLSGKPPLQESTETTHYSIVDSFGNAVSVTYTLNAMFGAKVIAGETGFFLNDEMDDFTAKPGVVNQFGLTQGEANAIAPGKRPLSSMTPTIILKGKKIIMVVGSRGGPRIITSTLEAILNTLVYGMTIQQAVNAPRFHHQWMPDTIYVEPNTFSASTKDALSEMGYQLTLSEPWGAVEAIYINPKTNKIEGANDNRQPQGAAVSL